MVFWYSIEREIVSIALLTSVLVINVLKWVLKIYDLKFEYLKIIPSWKISSVLRDSTVYQVDDWWFCH
jgi:hypothetical protein